VLIVDPNLGVNSVAGPHRAAEEGSVEAHLRLVGRGTSTHLAGEMLGDMIGVKLTHIPYKGTPPAMLDVSSGQVTFMFDQITAALPLVQAGKLKLLAVTTAKRMALAPQLPTMARPACRASRWRRGRRSMRRRTCRRRSRSAVDRDHQILQMPDVKDKLTNQLGMEVVAGSPAQLAALMQKEIPRWGELVRKVRSHGQLSPQQLSSHPTTMTEATTPLPLRSIPRTCCAT
jgi:tripartite-type tricarboxylate transporter receptor subunit TctC